MWNKVSLGITVGYGLVLAYDLYRVFTLLDMHWSMALINGAFVAIGSVYGVYRFLEN